MVRGTYCHGDSCMVVLYSMRYGKFVGLDPGAMIFPVSPCVSHSSLSIADALVAAHIGTLATGMHCTHHTYLLPSMHAGTDL